MLKVQVGGTFGGRVWGWCDNMLTKRDHSLSDTQEYSQETLRKKLEFKLRSYI